MTSPTPATTTIQVEEPRWQRWAVLLLPTLTFLVGLGLGAVVVLASEPERAVPETAAESPAPSSPPGEGTDDTVVTLPGACTDAAENLTEATRLLDDVAAAVRDFRPDELVGLLDQLEDLDAEVRSQTAECSRVQVSGSPSPEPSPTG